MFTKVHYHRTCHKDSALQKIFTYIGVRGLPRGIMSFLCCLMGWDFAYFSRRRFHGATDSPPQYKSAIAVLGPIGAHTFGASGIRTACMQMEALTQQLCGRIRKHGPCAAQHRLGVGSHGTLHVFELTLQARTCQEDD